MTIAQMVYIRVVQHSNAHTSFECAIAFAFTGVKCTNRFNILFCKSNSNNDDDDCDFNTPDEDSSSEKEGSDITKNNTNCMNVNNVINGLKAGKYTIVKSPGVGRCIMHSIITTVNVSNTSSAGIDINVLSA